jgi:DNA-binding transcriptional MerR regulator
MAAGTPKSPSAFLTIGELAEELGLPHHILRYWETRFPQLKPLQRAGNRRYYRPDDANLARQINRWLNVEGYTVKGVQKLLTGRGTATVAEPSGESAPPAPVPTPHLVAELTRIRDNLSRALAADDIGARA